MSPVDVLKEEHRLIERVLDGLVAYAARAAVGDDVPIGDLDDFVRFGREFVDADHHGKEEDLLFAAVVEEVGADPSGLAELLDEHAQGRRTLDRIAEIAERGSLTGQDRTALLREVTDWATMLRRHILAEDRTAFPRAEALLSEAVMAELDRQLVRFEAARPGRIALFDLAERLIASWADCGDCGCGGAHRR